jgi:hypothetical protein
MKKATIVIALLVACFAGTATAQDAYVPTWAVGFDFRGMLPMGDFGDASEWGVGGTGFVAYNVTPQVAITGRTGYLYFGGKELAYDDGITTGKIKINMNAIPILAGAKIFFSEGDMRVYGAGEVGLFMMSGSATITPDGGGAEMELDSDSESKFGVVPALGAQFKAGDNMNVDVHANFANIFTEGSSTNWVGFGIGFEWIMN